MKPLRSWVLAPWLLFAACSESSTPDPTQPVADAGTRADGGTAQPPPTGEPVPADAGTSVEAPRYEHYIRRRPYANLVLEVDGWGGYTPTASVSDKLAKGLLGVLDKERVEVVVDQAFPGKGADHAWTNQELYSLAEQTVSLAVPEGTIKLHVMLVDGHSASDTADGKVLGLAFPWTHLVLFRQTMDSVCNKGSPLNQCAKAELGVWAHEVGHQLGLVNNGLAMTTTHQDSAHGAHDTNDQCVMYWAYEGSSGLSGLVGLFGDAPNLGFDDACLADLNAVKTRP